MAEGRYGSQFLARACHSYVQPSPAAFRKQRAKTQRQAAGPVLAISDADDDCVALVALNPFQILHKKPFTFAGVKKSAEICALLQRLVEGSLNPIHVANAHRNYAQGLIWATSSMFEHERYHPLHFLRRALFLAIHTNLLFNQDMANRGRSAWSRKRDQAILIDVVV